MRSIAAILLAVIVFFTTGSSDAAAQPVENGQNRYILMDSSLNAHIQDLYRDLGGNMVMPIDAGDPQAGDLQVWEFPRTLSENDLLETWNANNGTVGNLFLLPGNPQEVVTLSNEAEISAEALNRLSLETESFGKGSLSVVQIPSANYLRAVMPYGVRSEGLNFLKGTAEEMGSLSFQVNDQLTLVAEPVAFEAYSDTGFEWTGAVAAQGKKPDITSTGFASFVVEDGNVSGVISHGGITYEIRPLGGGAHAIIDFSKVLVAPDGEVEEEGELLLPDDEDNKDAELEDPADVPVLAETVELDVLITFSRQGAAKVGNTNTYARNAIRASNTSYQVSGIRVKLNLVGVHIFNEDEIDDGNQKTRDDFIENRDRIIGTNDGLFDSVHDLRAQMKADIVVLIVANSSLAGFATNHVNKSNAFTAVYQANAIGNFSMVHEIGHFITAAHARGHIVPESGWVSVMKYGRDTRCPFRPAFGINLCLRDGYWSDPSQNHPVHGFPRGGNSNQNNVKRHNGTGNAKKVSNFF